ncbi:MAG: alpha-amylase family glycosyl hydrolase, partial [Bacteroidota bacterium]|nr:alpha-amylase family glycosyl hydrolase [Bacteroidota bacterium]
VFFYVKGDNPIAEIPEGWHRGVNYFSDDSVGLVLYAPNKEYIFVIGDFTDWGIKDEFLMNETPEGDYYWLGIGNLTANQEYIFQYYIDGEIRIADPYTDKISDPDNDKYITDETYPNLISYPDGKTREIASVLQTNQSEYEWDNSDFKAPETSDLVIYELHIRDFIAKHDYKTLIDTLNYLDNLGVNAIELMPINEFEGNESWGYNPSFYFAPDKYYGQKDDLKAFIDSCHGRDIAVITDMVLNHSFGQSPLVRMYFDSNAGEYGQATADNPWYNQVSPNQTYSWGFDFNHESEETKAFVDSVNSYWLTNYKIDGFRFDFTKGFTNTPGEGWVYDIARINILKRMAQKIWDVNTDAYVILEHLAENSEEKELANFGMMLWGNMNYEYNEATMGWDSDLSGISYKNRGWNSSNLVGYMESHDEERLMYKNLQYGNSIEGYNIKDLYIGLKRVELAANFFIPVPGPKMIWQFGELGYDISIDEPCRVCNKPIHWDYFISNRKKLYYVFKELNNLKTNYDVFSTDNFNLSQTENTKTLHLFGNEMNVVILGNFDIETKEINPSFPNIGNWYEFYTSDTLNVSNTEELISLLPGEYRLYTSVKLGKPNIPSTINNFFNRKNSKITVFPNPSKDIFSFII